MEQQGSFCQRLQVKLVSLNDSQPTPSPATRTASSTPSHFVKQFIIHFKEDWRTLIPMLDHRKLRCGLTIVLVLRARPRFFFPRTRTILFRRLAPRPRIGLQNLVEGRMRHGLVRGHCAADGLGDLREVD